mgnify:CR=1 FL=1
MANKPVLGERISQMRRKLGFSQAELARRTGFHPSFISQLESGKRKGSSYETLATLAEALNVEVQQLFHT